MQPSKNNKAVIHLSPEALRINGNSQIILCASLFYFRLPQGVWKERLLKVKSVGYNAIDVYFPWNHHETQEGVWDFSGEKDAAQFLKEASDAGLWVIARPGPYICSEWDGGALPAYLFVKDDLHIRENDPHYLQHVARWYGQILPIIRNYENGQGGTVIAVQLENELDFYPCADPKGYISALRDMAVQHGISVPLLACAGQGGLQEASGFSEDVVPTCNFYPNDRDPFFEEKVLWYREKLARYGYPLLVTETNRSHFLLRRLLSAGAKMLGPYLQASGTNFGFTNAANNWGNPLSFLTSDYDFNGMLTPEGHLREEAYEGKLLARLIQTFGRSLAEATPVESLTGPHRLALKQGGELLFLTNVSDTNEDAYIQCSDERIPRYTALIAAGGHCPALPVQIPLQTWDIPASGTLAYATAELFAVKQLANRTLLVFHTDGEGELCFTFDTEVRLEGGDMQVHEEAAGQVIVSYRSSEKEARARIHVSEHHVIEIIGLNRTHALLLENIDEIGNLQTGAYPERITESADLPITWAQSLVNPVVSLGSEEIALGDSADFLEKNGIYRGFAWYTAQLKRPKESNYLGYMLQQASDVISLYSGDSFLGTLTPGGTSDYVPIPTETPFRESLTARVEIWGHTNFHDTNLPALHLNSLKGLKGIAGIISVQDLNQNWRYQRMSPGEDKEDYAAADVNHQHWPIVSIGGWLSTEQPAHQCYRKQVRLTEEADTWMLHTVGNFTHAYAYVNGQALGQLNPLNPYMDLTPYVKAGETATITLFLDKTYGSLGGQVSLYEGVAAKEWTLSACQEAGLLRHADKSKLAAHAVEVPLLLKPGTVSWLYGELKDDNQGLGWRICAKGKDLKLTIFFNGHLIGRLWTQGGANRPVFRGGSDDSVYVPGPWFRNEDEGNEIVILLEAVSAVGDALLEPLRFVPVTAN
ncbi:beta-galactosidase [Paenibacillus planticolens]|uniref:beta-galactosidase n=1 Tax=Paenibacillus planticolens TaxID=2654976 RepID=UPI001493277F|nr:beta-galactosidase [Paenibacillus planticolens]